jgi:addiction module HigA family antidote
VLKKHVTAPLGLSVTEAAKRLGISRGAFARILNGKAGIGTDLAVRLELAQLSTAYSWVVMQAKYDQWQVTWTPPLSP